MSWSPFLPPSEWNKCWLLTCSTRHSISLLWVPWFGKTTCQSWSHAISPYRWIEAINPPTWCVSPWSACWCLLKWLIFFVWFLLRLFILSPHIRSLFITKIIWPFLYLTLSAYFLFLAHCCHINGHLYSPLWKYHHLRLSLLLPFPWWNVLLPTNLGFNHPHHNCLAHSCCRCHHYDGVVDHLSGFQNILRPPARPRWCSLDSIQKLPRFKSAAVYPPSLALIPWWLYLLYRKFCPYKTM